MIGRMQLFVAVAHIGLCADLGSRLKHIIRARASENEVD